MFIQSIYLNNIRCFTEISIDFSAKDGARKWAIILGDNGTGKTTLLRSIAVGLCDQTGAAGLVQDTYGDWIFSGAKKGVIEISLIDNGNKHTITTTIQKGPSGTETLIQKRSKNFPWNNLFVCGYGANRSIRGSKLYDEYSLADAVYTLFEYSQDLQTAELMLRRRATTLDELNEACLWIDTVLMLEEGSTKLDERGLMINGPWNSDMSFLSIPDGHAAIITLIADMLGWALLDGRRDENNNINAIVLIDELEQHLHPIWQKKIASLLHSVFKNIQFITTSHSPLCAIGTANLSDADEKCSLIVLNREEDDITSYDQIKPPKNKRADQVLTSYLFGMESTRSDSFTENIESYSNLLAKKDKTVEENITLSNLQEIIKKSLSEQESHIDDIGHQAFQTTLDDVLSKQFDADDNLLEGTKIKVNKKYMDLLGLGGFDDKD